MTDSPEKRRKAEEAARRKLQERRKTLEKTSEELKIIENAITDAINAGKSNAYILGHITQDAQEIAMSLGYSVIAKLDSNGKNYTYTIGW